MALLMTVFVVLKMRQRGLKIQEIGGFGKDFTLFHFFLKSRCREQGIPYARAVEIKEIDYCTF